MSEKRYLEGEDRGLEPIDRSIVSPGKMPASARLFPGALLRKARDANGVGEGAEAAVSRATGSSGTPLPEDVRERFETSLGADLSGVRVHSGVESADAASAVGAKAYTVGNDIHFADGNYAPTDPFGLHLLAHEVAHTVQQAGVPQGMQYKLEVSSPDDAAEVEADRAADAIVKGDKASITSGFGVARKSIARVKEAPTPFAGAAGTADMMGQEAGKNAGGSLSPINIGKDYCQKRIEYLSGEMERFDKETIPGYSGDNKDTAIYKTIAAQRDGYFADIQYLAMGEQAYNSAVEPTAIADKSFAQFRTVQKQLGYNDDMVDNEGSSDFTGIDDKQKKALRSKLDEKKLNELDAAVESQEKSMMGSRKIIIGEGMSVRAAGLRIKASEQAKEAKAKGDEKAEIDKNIKEATEAVETISKVLEVIGAVASGVGAPEAMEKGLMETVKTGAEVGKGATTLAGGIVQSAMMAMNKDKIDELNRAVETAKGKQAAYTQVELKATYDAAMIKLSGETDKMAAAAIAYTSAIKARKDYLAEVGAAADKAAGGGNGVSQFMAMAAAAKETTTYIASAKGVVATAKGVVASSKSSIANHRGKLYGTIDDASYGANKVEPTGPDYRTLASCESALDAWVEGAGKRESVLGHITSALNGST
jgi:hypothetical protein